MGSFDEISKTAADGFNSWLDEQLPKQKLDKVVGFNFNCYEDADHHWAVELVGTSAFSEQITDWACEELFATRKNPFVTRYGGPFQEVLEIVEEWISAYLDQGTYKDELKEKAGIGIGFVDGDLKMLYKNPDYRPAKLKKAPESDTENYYQIYSAADSGDSRLCLKMNESELPFGRYEVYQTKRLPAERIYCTAEQGAVDSRDYLDNNLAFFIVSGKVKAIMTCHDIESCQFIDVVDQKTGDTIGYLVNCLKRDQACDTAQQNRA